MPRSMTIGEGMFPRKWGKRGIPYCTQGFAGTTWRSREHGGESSKVIREGKVVQQEISDNVKRKVSQIKKITIGGL